MIRPDTATLRFPGRFLPPTAALLVGMLVPLGSFADGDRSRERVPKQASIESTVSESTMKHAMQQYIDGFNRHDSTLLISLFADDATIEDPVGGGRIVAGRDAITAFYRRAVKRVDRLELDTPIRASHGRSAAMAFTIHLKTDDRLKYIRTIDVMSFDDTGRILEMKAFHGTSDVFE